MLYSMQCCGLAEFQGIKTMEADTLIGLARDIKSTLIPHKCFYIMTTIDGNTERYKELVEKEHLGDIVITKAYQSPTSGRRLQVMVFHPEFDNFFAWVERVSPNYLAGAYNQPRMQATNNMASAYQRHRSDLPTQESSVTTLTSEVAEFY